MKKILSKRGDMVQGENGVSGWLIMILLAVVIFGSIFAVFGDKIITWLKLLIP